MNTKAQKHPFAPVFESDSKVLILGSFPPKSSIEAGFYYGDLKNRFWDILGALFGDSDLKSKSKDDKIAFLKSNRIALWDIWGYCYKNPQDSASDDSIIASESRFVDLSEILRTAKIQKIFTTIGGSETYAKDKEHPFNKWGVREWIGGYFENIDEILCPLCSTSGETRRSADDLIKKYGYKQIKEILEK
ncbi:uracil-DNA glycosylase family protein [Helicobacter sp. 23-1045]